MQRGVRRDDSHAWKAGDSSTAADREAAASRNGDLNAPNLHRRRVRRGSRQLIRRTGFGLSVAALLAGLGLLASIGWFYLRSDIVGGSLIHRQEAIDAAANRQAITRSKWFTVLAPVCHPPAPTAGAPRGLVEAPSIGLVAPVLEGSDDAELDVAVGHVPASTWPGSTGTVVLAAHDVSWFSQIEHLKVGDTIRFVAPCQTFTYRVTNHQVVSDSDPVYNTPEPQLVLITCYPLNALYVTPNRYLVAAQLTNVTNGGRVTPLPPSNQGMLSSPLPAALAASVGQRVTSTAPLGSLAMAGAPTPAWTESLQPIRGEESVLTLYFGSLVVAQDGDSATWSQIAPNVTFSAAGPLLGAQIIGYPGSVNPTIAALGNVTTGASISATVALAGGPDPGDYAVSMTSQVENGELVITGWTMERQ
jgi:sortase A